MTQPEEMALEWLARLVEQIGYSVDAEETTGFYIEVCGLYNVEPRQLHIAEPSDDDEDMGYINEPLGRRENLHDRENKE